MSKYHLSCLECGKQFVDENFILSCDQTHTPAFLRSEYSSRKLSCDNSKEGIYQFISWLPTDTPLEGSHKPITYKSVSLSKFLGLKNLYISFSGYWPEREAYIYGCSFKELEAYTTLSRLLDAKKEGLVIASAGNTARSYAMVCADNNIPAVIVVPRAALADIWTHKKKNPCVKLVGVNGDYTDAIHVAHGIAKNSKYCAPSGALNVAKRDGLGVAVLEAVVTIGKFPDHYFQAVGSGAGAIAAWEANLRYTDDRGRRSTERMMKLYLSQNEPFTPVADNWNVKSKTFEPAAEEISRARAQKVSATVLTNRQPHYTIRGGLYHALTQTQGEVLNASNQEVFECQKLFEELEGIDIVPAAAVAVASLRKAVSRGSVDLEDSILLNITGGGIRRLQKDFMLQTIEPSLLVDPSASDSRLSYVFP